MSFVCLNTRWCTYTADRCRYFRHIFCMLKYACMCMLVSTSKKCTCVHAYRIRTKRLSSSLMPDLTRKHLQRNLLPQARWRLLRVRSERGLTSRQRPLHASTHALLSTSRVVTFLWTFRSQRCQFGNVSSSRTSQYCFFRPMCMVPGRARYIRRGCSSASSVVSQDQPK